MLDVACGFGRHLRWFLERNHPVVGVDRSSAAIEFVASLAQGRGRMVCADIEKGPWPLANETFSAVIVTNYLWRPLMPQLLSNLAPGGMLIYETFASGNETVGKPSRPDFLLQPGELLRVCAGLHVVAYEDGFLDTPPRFVQRIAAVRALESPLENPLPTRHPL